MAKKKKSKIAKKPNVSEELKGLDFTINTLGKIKSTYDIDKINDFLNSRVEDKKLREKKNSEEGLSKDKDS